MSIESINTLLNKAEVKCNQSGTKLTLKRKLILQQLLESDRLLSAYEIVERIKVKENNTMPAMSVYRILGILESSNLVHKIESQNKYIACSHIKCNHSHQSAQFLICEKCDFIKEINLNHTVIENIDHLSEQENFKLKFSVMEFKGVCQNCQT